ncbi:MAG: energy transducer TonB [Cytophagaceae bacterium]
MKETENNRIALVPDATLTDIVFEHRNKAYGAFFLRKIYGSHVTVAVMLSVALFTIALVSPKIIEKLFPNKIAEEVVTEVDLNLISLDQPKEEELPPPPPPPPMEEPPKIAMSEFLEPEVAPDEQVKKDPPKNEEMINPGTMDQDGDPNLEEPVDFGTGDGRIEGPADEIFMYVEEYPEHLNGDVNDFINKNIRYPVKAQNAGIEGRVYVEFVIGTDGTVIDAKAVKGIGFGCDEEAVRVIKLTKWTPAKQNGKPVKLKRIVHIIYKMPE